MWGLELAGALDAVLLLTDVDVCCALLSTERKFVSGETLLKDCSGQAMLTELEDCPPCADDAPAPEPSI